ncbi:DNA-formamidopyrimidine glycosylase [Alteribacillus bidgolensis]|uniref:Formamidopyrimidine-DNA glycosylase n=1 Tax=Alteribacillus bidgolensis TaxID=930129 RepID=A0A1G8EY78_9BACI|nr:DNA-formamidopyrimidine glycosylase [Alteribacillus bidgolensis]SDH74848.1 DNA-(apurinic or apyrimidinic site) lyase [Alteribacillus bidgolensis]
MPELPEVETVRRTLTKLVKGKKVEQVDVTWPKIIKKPDDIEAFDMLLHGQEIQHIGRRGKFLTFQLNDYVLVSHLRMEGKYEMGDGSAPDKHTHVRFFFSDGTELRYKDVRKFGTMHLFPKGEEMSTQPLSQLGPEPFEDPTFTPDYLKETFQATSRDVKTVLLDQRAVAGLGNIYVDEALFKAGIRPDTKAALLSNSKIAALHEKVEETISNAVLKGGSSVRSYVNGNGEMGLFQLELHVYGRQGEGCRVCGSEIIKTVVAGRGTHYCSSCQPAIVALKGK